MSGIEDIVSEAAHKAAQEKLVLPFSYDSLNTAYVLMRDQYSTGKDLFVPDELRQRVNEDSVKEMGEAELKLHSFMGTLIEHFWDAKPVEISMIANGRCPMHPNDELVFRKILSEKAVGKIMTSDYVLTSETIGKCPEHPDQQLYADVSQLEYHLKQDRKGGNGVIKFQSRIKRTSMIDKLTRGIIGDKPYALDFRGGRAICEGFESYVDVSRYLLDRVASNGSIHVIPVSGAIEEHVAKARKPETYLSALLNQPELLSKEEPYYESLHLLIRYMGVPIEFQCRDKYMHEVAERGDAAHREYKEKELQSLAQRYPDFCEKHEYVKEIYKSMIPENFKLYQAPFAP